MKTIRVAVLEDSALIRRVMAQIINAQDGLEYADVSANEVAAHELIGVDRADVLLLDVRMILRRPSDAIGHHFLRQISRTVIFTCPFGSDAPTTLQMADWHAVDWVHKPRLGNDSELLDYAQALTQKILLAASPRLAPPLASQPPGLLKQATSRPTNERLIIVGASTGGTEAISEMLAAMPADAPGILITQHMPRGFTKNFAERLDKLCRVSVKEARHGERVLPGHVYIAPGDRHLLVTKVDGRYQTGLSSAPPVNRHRPSVDVLFRSAAKVAGPSVVGVMLTGMGKDGASAMRELRTAGAYNLAQDEATCIVFGMPREAISTGAVHQVLPLPAIAPHILAHFARGRMNTALS